MDFNVHYLYLAILKHKRVIKEYKMMCSGSIDIHLTIANIPNHKPKTIYIYTLKPIEDSGYGKDQ